MTQFPLKPLALCCLLAFAAMERAAAQPAPGALPTGGSVAAGQAAISQNAAAMQVRQSSQQAIIDWQSYNIGRDASVQYIQPNAGASVLNRVLNGSSEIAGRLSGNGRVFLLNASGVTFSPTARVDVGSLGVAAGTASNASWLAGAAEIHNSGSVLNQGEIRTADGGSVALTGLTVSNSGSISAPRGAISLAAGDAVRLNITADGLIQAQVTGAAAQALVDNSGLLDSESGRIALAASTAAGTAGGLVANSGIIRASGVAHNGGTVSLTGGQVQAGGAIDASSTGGDGGKVDVFGDLQHGSVAFSGSINAGAGGNGNGGAVETSAAKVTVAGGARVNTLSGAGKAGTWLIDPQDFTIGTAAGDDISGATLSANLDSSNVSIDSAAGVRAGTGNIYVNNPVSWSANTTLALKAASGIVFASGPVTDPSKPNLAALANLTATGNTAGLLMDYSTDYVLGANKITLSGSTPTVGINGTSYVVMNAFSTAALNTILRTQPGRAFALTSDIDATATAALDNGQGWLPVGDNAVPFSGLLAGFGHTISKLAINRPTTDNIGLVGVMTGSVRDLGLIDPSITGRNGVGGIAGSVASSAGASIRSSYTTGGGVKGTSNVGGLLGDAGSVTSELISDSYASGTGIGSGAGQAHGALLGSWGPNNSLVLHNSYYNLDSANINGKQELDQGALYAAQFADWLKIRKLNIADYGSSLPLDSASGYYMISDAQGMRDLLGFAGDKSAGLKVRLAGNIDLSASAGYFIPVLQGEFDGAGRSIAGMVVNAPSHGGLVGINNGLIRNVNLQNSTISAPHAGGVAGLNAGTVTNSLSGNNTITGSSEAGGLVGTNQGVVSNSGSEAKVSGPVAGGLVGLNEGIISNSYATGSVTGTVLAGGLVGSGDISLVTSSYWDTQTSGQAGSSSGSGKTTAEMRSSATYVGWDLASVWRMSSAGPVLRAISPQAIALTIAASSLTRNYGSRVTALELSVTPTGLTDGDSLSSLGGTLSYTGTWQTATNIGVYTIIPGGLISSKYDITFVNGALTVTKADLTLAAVNASKVYGAADPTLRFTASGLKYNDTISVVKGATISAPTGAAATAGTHAIAMTVTGATADNYNILSATGGTLTVSKASLALSPSNASTVYGVNPSLTLAATGLFYGDSASVVSGVNFNTTTGAAAKPGTYPITLSGGTAANYNITGYGSPATLTVDKATLTVRADDKSKLLADPDPALTYSVLGLVYADTRELVTGVSLSTKTGADATVGSHPIVSTGGVAANYIVRNENGTLVVSLPPVIPPEPEKPVEPPVATKSLDTVVVVQAAAPAKVEPEKPVATVGGVVSAQRKALFEPANQLITNNPNIASLKDCGSDNEGECIARPRTPVQARIDTEGQAAPAAVIKRKMALVIGNQLYGSPLTSLEGAGADAEAVGYALKKQGYEVLSLNNASRAEMVTGMNKLIKDADGADSVLVFYAGHGHIHPGSSVGYWIPADGRIDNPRGWLSNIDIARFLANIPARQVLLVSDSCFSGALTRETGAASGSTLSRNAILNRRSVVAMSSGGEEVVADSAFEGHSPFTYFLLAELEKDSEQPAKVVLEKVREQVRKSAEQVPAYGAIVSSGHVNGGEYLVNPVK
ncbi:MBG domain-containing protein [Pseudoduganella sp. LjRoot289]|uniref:MBG domain-containing protein n=1 Tax=Pseudoduganella sp. LjRoot289 TaxID=3342314 RepID=UPI003ECC199D